MNLPLLFWWEGADGSRVLTLRIWHSYDAGPKLIQPAASGAFAPGFDHAAFFLGVGDHGGAVTKEQIQQILALQQDASFPQLRFSTLRDFFLSVESSSAFSSLPVVQTELQHHSRGCYSANGEGKFFNRRAERSLGEAETISLVANLSAGNTYPADQYAEAWWKVLFCQFHDMMAGTSLYSDYQDVRDSVGYVCEVAQTSKMEALERLAKRGHRARSKRARSSSSIRFPGSEKLSSSITPTGSLAKVPHHLPQFQGRHKVPIQWRPSASMTTFVPRLSAWVELLPCGYKVFDLAHGDPRLQALRTVFTCRTPASVFPL